MAENGRSRTVLWIVIGGGVFFLFVLAVFTLVYLALHAGGEEASLHSFGDKIGVVELEGVILDSSVIVPQLKKFGDDDSIKAIILKVNSPGGGVAASEEIYREVKRLRDEKHKRIVASISTVGASGAYYVSSATNKIYADNGSVVGSIGVIAEWGNYGSLMRGVTSKAEALPKHVIDQIGDFQTAVDDTAKSVGIRGEPVLIRPDKDRKTLADLLFGDISQWLPTREKLMDQQVGFYYLWK